MVFIHTRTASLISPVYVCVTKDLSSGAFLLLFALLMPLLSFSPSLNFSPSLSSLGHCIKIAIKSSSRGRIDRKPQQTESEGEKEADVQSCYLRSLVFVILWLNRHTGSVCVQLVTC